MSVTAPSHSAHPISDWFGIEPKYLAGNLARVWESVKNLAAFGSQAERAPMPVRIGLTLLAFYATFKFQGYYGKDAHDELKLDKVPDENVGKPSWIDFFAPQPWFSRSDGPANFAVLASIVAGLAAILVRSKPVKESACAKQIMDTVGKCAAWAMTGSETLLAQLSGRGVVDAVTSVVAGGGTMTPKAPGAPA